jgi:zinc transport system permease protein
MPDWNLQFELFWRPCLTGALLALLLPLLGLYIRLRREYWAALAYGQIGAAGALGALALGMAAIPGALAASLGVALMKDGLDRRLPAAGLYPLLFLAGWGASLLLAANSPAIERLGEALFEGQLYFASRELLYWALGALLLGAAGVWRYGRILLFAHLHPLHCAARGVPAWPGRAFDLIVAASLALAVMCLGVMGTFALVFIPPWLVFARAPSWRAARVAAPLLALLAYGAAFALALSYDQPFGPVLVLVLCLAASCGWRFSPCTTRKPGIF